MSPAYFDNDLLVICGDPGDPKVAMAASCCGGGYELPYCGLLTGGLPIIAPPSFGVDFNPTGVQGYSPPWGVAPCDTCAASKAVFDTVVMPLISVTNIGGNVFATYSALFNLCANEPSTLSTLEVRWGLCNPVAHHIDLQVAFRYGPTQSLLLVVQDSRPADAQTRILASWTQYIYDQLDWPNAYELLCSNRPGFISNPFTLQLTV